MMESFHSNMHQGQSAAMSKHTQHNEYQVAAIILTRSVRVEFGNTVRFEEFE